MTTRLEDQIFLERLKDKILELGFGDSVASSVAKMVRCEHKENNTVFITYKPGLFSDMFFKTRQSELIPIAKDCWGSSIELFVKPDTSDILVEPTTKKRSRSAERKNDTLFPVEKTTPTVPQEPIEPIFSHIEVEDHALVCPEKSDVELLEKIESEKNYYFKPNPSMTFATFVQGSSNQMAALACENAAREPGVHKNPVFIYGHTGLGKTHLLQAVGNEILRKFPKHKVLFGTSEEFLTELNAAIRFKKQEAFRNKYRSCDVLLFDDVQFFERYETTQIEFFHTFNELYNAKKQIIITSDKYPKEIPKLEDRLRSRFLQGLIVDVEPPSFEDRFAIIEAKRKAMGLKFPREVSEHIATHITSNVREIEGFLNGLLMHQTLTGHALTIPMVDGKLRRILRTAQTSNAIDVSTIQKHVANHFSIKLNDLIGQSRSAHLAWPRHVAMYLTKELTSSPSQSIAESFGKKDHTTVLHAVKTVQKKLLEDQAIKAILGELKHKILNPPL